MSKISKTAAASMKGAQMAPKVDPFDTNEKKIKELRNQRRDKLAVGRFDFIDALIEEYYKVQLLLAQEIANVVVRDEALAAAQKINQTLLNMNEKLNGDLNIAILQRDNLALEIVTAKASITDLSSINVMISEGGNESTQEN